MRLSHEAFITEVRMPFLYAADNQTMLLFSRRKESRHAPAGRSQAAAEGTRRAVTPQALGWATERARGLGRAAEMARGKVTATVLARVKKLEDTTQCVCNCMRLNRTDALNQMRSALCSATHGPVRPVIRCTEGKSQQHCKLAATARCRSKAALLQSTRLPSHMHASAEATSLELSHPRWTYRAVLHCS